MYGQTDADGMSVIDDEMNAGDLFATIFAALGIDPEKEYMLGDEFTTKVPPELRLKLIGTAPFAKVTLIVDDEERKVWEPGKAEVEIAWTDPSPREGETSYYYFRGEQEDAEIVWVSPMWIRYAP